MVTARRRGASDPRPGVNWMGTRPLVSGAPVLIGAIVLGIALLAMALTLGRRPGLPAALSAAYTATMAGTLAPDIAVTDPEALAADLRQAGAGFTPRVVSLADFRLLGGRIYDVDGRAAATWIYESPRMDHALALAFRGTLDELGAPDDTRSDSQPNLRIHRKMTQTIVCWQDGPIVYVLVATLPSERVIALARRLATPAGTPREATGAPS